MSRKKGSRILTKRRPEGFFEKMGKEKQVGHTPTPSENTNNQTSTGTERDSRGDRNRKITRKKQSQESWTTSREACQMLAQCSGPRTTTIRKAPKTSKSAYCSMWWKTTRKG